MVADRRVSAVPFDTYASGTGQYFLPIAAIVRTGDASSVPRTRCGPWFERGRLPRPDDQVPRLSRNLRLYVYTALQIALGFSALAIVTVLLPIQATIAVYLPGVTPSVAIPVGVGSWVVLALVGSALFPERRGGAITIFDLPFIVAATVLGGAVAGGWVAMIGSLELRELRGVARREGAPAAGSAPRVPWYGIPANHALTTLAAIAGGLVLLAARPFLDGVLGAASMTGTGAHLVWTLIVAVVFVALTDGLAFEALALRSDRSFADVLDDFGPDHWVMAAAEAVMAWLMIEVFLVAGWWAPAVCVAALLGIWRSRPQDDRLDPLTGLLDEAEFRRRTARLLDRWYRGGRRVVVLHLELDELDRLNDQLGRLGGDRVLKAVGDRLRASLRPLDDAARFEAGVFAALLVLRDEPAFGAQADPAEPIAWRLLGNVAGDAAVDGRIVEIRAAIGVAVVPARQEIAAGVVVATARRACRAAQAKGTMVEVRVVRPSDQDGAA